MILILRLFILLTFHYVNNNKVTTNKICDFDTRRNYLRVGSCETKHACCIPD
jgi:hypothetical protein